MQGKLVRALEQLRDEARRNGNLNRGDGHVLLANSWNTRFDSGLFDELAMAEIRQDIARLLDFEHPETSDEPAGESINARTAYGAPKSTHLASR